LSREKPGYRDILADLHRRYPDVDMLTPAQVAEVTGLTVQTVRRKFCFNALTRRVAMADLARQICA
jgi:hypothetical protein